MRGAFAAIALATATLSGVTWVLATEYIVNGDFETGDFSGWTRFGALGSTSVNATSDFDGDFGASFSPNQQGGIQQSFATIPGRVYTITLWLAHTAGAATPINSFFLDFGGVNIAGFSGYGALPFAKLTYAATATAPVSTLKLTFRDARPTVFRLDDVSVTAVPEPATWALMLAGFGAAGVMRRRERDVAA